MEGKLTQQQVQQLASIDNVAAHLLGHEPTPQEASQIQAQVAQSHGGIVPPGSIASVVRSEVERGGGPQLPGQGQGGQQGQGQAQAQISQGIASIDNVAQKLLGHEPTRQEAAWIQSETARQRGGIVPRGSAASVIRAEAERTARGGAGAGAGGGAGQ